MGDRVNPEDLDEIAEAKAIARAEEWDEDDKPEFWD